jgi:hypothetical protein
MKNKITIIVVLVGALLSSCKKERSCECTATYSNSGNSDTFTVKYTYKNITKKQIEIRCASHDASSNTFNSTTTYDCIVK